MSTRVEPIEEAAQPWPRWLIVSALGCAIAATAAALLRRRPVKPSLPPMSEEWMASHGLDAGRQGDY